MKAKFQKGKWRISIDDTHVEYRYIMDISDGECINSVYELIRELFKSRRRKGVLRGMRGGL